MSFELTAWAIRQKPINKSEKLILIVLSDCLNHKTGQCNPSLAFISNLAMCSRNCVISGIKALEHQGYITVIRQHNKSNTYKFNGEKRPQATTDVMSTGSAVSAPASAVSALPEVQSVVPEQGTNQEGTRRESAPVKNRVVQPKKSIEQDASLSDDNFNAATRYFTDKCKPLINPIDEWQKFKAYHISRGTRFACWDSAWLSWCIKAVEFDKSQSTRARSLADDVADRSWAA